MIFVLSLGSMKNHLLRPAIDDYLQRMDGFCTLQEGVLKGKTDSSTQQNLESQWLLDHIPQGSYVILMDEKGSSYESIKFAQRLDRLQSQNRHVSFLIGGAYGHSSFLRQRSHEMMSLGPGTFPHMMARLVLIEQIYRAKQILSHHPYHKEG